MVVKVGWGQVIIGSITSQVTFCLPLQVPSALLTFSWDASVLEDIRAAGAEPAKSVLRPELLAAIEQLS